MWYGRTLYFDDVYLKYKVTVVKPLRMIQLTENFWMEDLEQYATPESQDWSGDAFVELYVPAIREYKVDGLFFDTKLSNKYMISSDSLSKLEMSLFRLKVDT